MKANNSLEKVAILESALATLLGHVGQNLAAEKQLLNEKGGREFVRQLIGTNKGKFIDGFGNAFVPEKGILIDEAREAIKELPNLDLKAKALLYRVATGKLDKATVNKVLSNRALTKILGSNISMILEKAKNLPDEAFDDVKKIHATNGVGRFAKGVAEELRHIDKNTLKQAINNNNKKEEIAGELLGNATLGAIEPGVAFLNATKRLMGAHFEEPKNELLHPLWKAHKKFQDFTNNKFVKKPLLEAYEHGKQGKEIGMIYGYGNNAIEKLMSGKVFDRYFFNRPLSELNNYANKLGLLAHKYGNAN